MSIQCLLYFSTFSAFIITFCAKIIYSMLKLFQVINITKYAIKSSNWLFISANFPSLCMTHTCIIFSSRNYMKMSSVRHRHSWCCWSLCRFLHFALFSRTVDYVLCLWNFFQVQIEIPETRTAPMLESQMRNRKTFYMCVYLCKPHVGFPAVVTGNSWKKKEMKYYCQYVDLENKAYCSRSHISLCICRWSYYDLKTSQWTKLMKAKLY